MYYPVVSYKGNDRHPVCSFFFFFSPNLLEVSKLVLRQPCQEGSFVDNFDVMYCLFYCHGDCQAVQSDPVGITNGLSGWVITQNCFLN